MPIERITISLVTLRLREPFTTSFGTYETLTRPLVVLETSDGLRGVGEVQFAVSQLGAQRVFFASGVVGESLSAALALGLYPA